MVHQTDPRNYLYTCRRSSGQMGWWSGSSPRPHPSPTSSSGPKCRWRRLALPWRAWSGHLQAHQPPLGPRPPGPTPSRRPLPRRKARASALLPSLRRSAACSRRGGPRPARRCWRCCSRSACCPSWRATLPWWRLSRRTSRSSTAAPRQSRTSSPRPSFGTRSRYWSTPSTLGRSPPRTLASRQRYAGGGVFVWGGFCVELLVREFLVSLPHNHRIGRIVGRRMSYQDWRFYHPIIYGQDDSVFLITLAGPGRRGSPGSTHEGGRCTEGGPNGGRRRGKRRESGAVSSRAACFSRGSFFEALTGVMIASCCGAPACSSQTIHMNNTYNEMNWKVVAHSNSWVTRTTRHKLYSHVEGCILLFCFSDTCEDGLMAREDRNGCQATPQLL